MTVQQGTLIEGRSDEQEIQGRSLACTKTARVPDSDAFAALCRVVLPCLIRLQSLNTCPHM